MTALECPREQEVVDAVAAGRWPGRVDPELRAHIADCELCRDVALVACAIDTEHEAAWAHVRVPSSAHVWWRAQMRARREAARAAARPITLAQGLAAAAAAGLAAAWATWIDWPTVAPWPWSDVRMWPDATVIERWRGAAYNLAMTAESLPAIEAAVAAGALLLIAPAALYFVFSEK